MNETDSEDCECAGGAKRGEHANRRALNDREVSPGAGPTEEVVRGGASGASLGRPSANDNKAWRKWRYDLFGAATALIVFWLDQGSKSAAFAHVARNGDWVVAPFLTMTSGWNTGVAFGLAVLADPRVLIAVALAISTLFAILLVRSPSPVEKLAFGSIIGGALSNVADRLRFGAVRDLIDAHWGSWHWPTFNLADAFITLGVIGLLIASGRGAKGGR